MPPAHRSAAVRRLARAVGVADAYEAAGTTHHPPDATVRAVLGALGHPCDDDVLAARSLRAVRRRAWTRPIAPVAVAWRGSGATRDPTHVAISRAADARPQLRLTLEDGTAAPLPAATWGGRVDLPSGARQRGTIALPADLPLGYHRLTLDDGQRVASCAIIVAPASAPLVGDAPRWGWMLQLYAVRSAASWGQGEFRDLAALTEWGARHGADFALINPVHACAPVIPVQPSPYSPTSRRFLNPCYLHVPDVVEYAALPPSEQPELLAPPPELSPVSDRIDRDAIWRAKRAALWRLFSRRSPARRGELDRFRAERGEALQRFAVFCAIAEQHGLPFARWPEQLQDPRDEAVGRWTAEHEEVVAFHAWLQLLCTRQLHAAQRRATAAGMAIGVIHDLAVGVDPGGADVWALPDEFARSMSVGAPPDAFNQHGQDWAQPPPLPDAMRAGGYQMLRDTLAAALTVGGGLRIDHILGLSRLFWIPRGAGPADGTYVHYRVEEQFAVVALEAHRADAVIIGEDLGTVDDRIRQLMRRRGIAGSAVLYFEVEDGRRRPADRYPPAALASVTTHDLPTATAWWDGSALQLRDELGLLVEPRAVAERQLADEHDSLLRLLRDHGCLPDDDGDVRARVLAMYRFLATTPSRLVAVALWDAVGDPRQPNVPGTVDAYPNWRLPLALPGPRGARPLLIEHLEASTAVGELVAVLDR